MTIATKMTAIANSIRSITGGTDNLTLDDMATDITDVSTEIDGQSDLIAQIQTALESKAAPDNDPVLQSKTVTPSTSSQTITADSGYDGLSSVTVNAMSTATQATPSISVSSAGLITASATQTAGYVSAGTKSATKQLTVKSSSDLTVSDRTVTVPAGYYTSSASASVATVDQATPSISVSSAGLITATSEQSAGYVSAGTKSATKPLTTKAATTYTPNTSNQTIASGTYLTGTQTIKGDSNLKSSNILSGVSIFGVAGSASSGAATQKITSASTAITIASAGASVSVYGYALYPASTYNKQTYAFVGDGYYVGANSYSNPSKTSATFTVGSDRTLSGLPRTFTAMELLVVAN